MKISLRLNNYLRKTGILFYLAILFDAGSMMLNDYLKGDFPHCYLAAPFTQEVRDFVYFFGQSLSRLFYILTIYIYTKEYFILSLIASAWTFFALNDSLQELMGNNTEFDWTEYLCGALTVYFIVAKVYRKEFAERMKNRSH